jgi:hypothetical protein
MDVGPPHADDLGVRAEVNSTEAPVTFERCVSSKAIRIAVVL